jgi:hypothetical protein
VTTRAEWQQLAEDRILDARAHLHPAVGRWSAAFYLVGYAIECGLKACVLAHVAAHSEVIYEDRKFSLSAWTHDFEVLVALAGLKALRDADTAANAARYDNWRILEDWSEEARYLQKTQTEAQQLFDAVAEPANGVMQWIRLHW